MILRTQTVYLTVLYTLLVVISILSFAALFSNTGFSVILAALLTQMVLFVRIHTLEKNRL